MKRFATICILTFCALMITSSAFAQVDVTATLGTPAQSYTTLKEAVDSINSGWHKGVIFIGLSGNPAETLSSVLNASGTGASSYTRIDVQPTGGAARTISGAIAAGSPLIDLNGADNVVIDGLNTGSNSLTISNTTVSPTAGTSTIRLINDATGDTVRNATVSGSGTGAGVTGTIIVGTTTGATGNDNNAIMSCNVGPAGASLPIIGILGSGTGASPNDNIIISNNNIFDFFSAATDGPRGVLAAAASNAWQITGNSFYQTATRTFTATVVTRTISIENTSGNNFLISANYIGGSAASAGGTAWTTAGAFAHSFIGIRISAGTTTATNVQGNFIQNISLTASQTSSVQAAISCPSGTINVGTVTPNTIGSQAATGNITITNATTGFFTGILSQIGTLGTFNISNNTIGGITMAGAGANTLRGIRVETGTVTSITISGNTIGSATTANSMSSNGNAGLLGISTTNATAPTICTNNTIANLTHTSTGTSASLRGIELTGSVSGQTISGNTIRTGTTTSTSTSATTTPAMVGILLTGTATSGNTITNNSIYDLSSTTAGATAVYNEGIVITSTPSTTISRNFIYNLTTASTSATSSIVGIQLFNSSATENIYNNMIRLGVGVGNNPIIRGIYDNSASSSPTNIRFNSIFITGTQGAATVNTSCVNRAVASTMDIRNNILHNNRASTGAPGVNLGRHYAINSSVATGTLTTDFNNLYADATGGTVGFLTSDRVTLTDWRGAGAGFDVNSFSASPSFVDPTNATTPDLHLTASNPESQGGQTVAGITDDFDGSAPGRPQPGATSPDIGADEGSFTLSPDLLAPSISYTALGNFLVGSSRILTGFATITDNSGSVSGGASAPRIYYKKSTNANAFVGNTSGDDGWKYAVASNASSPYDFTIDYTIILGGSVAVGDIIQYFVVAQDAGDNLKSNPTGASAGSTPPVQNISSFVGTANSYVISSSFSGTVTIGTSPGPSNSPATVGTFPTMKAFFDSLNIATVTGDITANVIGDLNEGTSSAILNAVSYSGGPWNILVQPMGGSFVDSGFNATGLIILNGADKVTFDGLGKTLRFKNTAAGPVFTLQNDATSDTVRSCVIEGAASGAATGSVNFSTSVGPFGGATGNDANVIAGNTIRDRSDVAGVPTNGVYSAGTVGVTNSGNIVTGNEIVNWTGMGVNLTPTGNGDGWTISGNSMFQTASRVLALKGIAVLSGAGHTISGNSIGGSSPSRAGTPMTVTAGSAPIVEGILLTQGVGPRSIISGNTIANIKVTSTAFPSVQGISITGTNGAIVHMNTIGGAASPYDTIMAGSDVYGIRQTSSGAVTITSNTISDFREPEVSGDACFGIVATAGIDTIANNVIRNMYYHGTATAVGFFYPAGIHLASAVAGNVIQGNTVHNLVQMNPGGSAYILVGITLGGSTNALVNANKVYGLSALGTGAGASAPVIIGIDNASGTGTYSNNMVALGTGVTSEVSFYGIAQASSTVGSNKFFYNSVNLEGAAGVGTNQTFGFLRISTAGTDTLRNNIFSNKRTGSTGRHFAIGVSSATGWGSGSSDRNLFSTSNPDSLGQYVGIGYPLGPWQVATGGDPGSISSAATGFLSPSTGDLHIDLTLTSAAANAGTPIAITTDYDGGARSGSTPDIGADEFTYPAPAAFALSSPADGSTGQPVSGTLSWAASTGATRYDVYMDGNPVPVAVVSANQAGTTYAYSVPSGTYYWDVVAENPDGSANSNNGPFDFTTVVPPATPSALTAVPTGPVPSEGSLPIVDVNASKEEISKIEERVELTLDAASGVQLSWTDNAGSGPNTEDSFYVYGKLGSAPAIGGPSSPDFLVALDSSAGSGGTVMYTHSSLGVNEHWYYKVTAKNAQGESTPASADTTTFINPPDAPTFSDVLSKSMKVIINTTGNPETTEEYAIQHVGSGQYVTAAGTIASATAVWQTYAAWGGLLGKNLTGLTRNTLYTFQVKGRNAANVETAFGPTGSQTTTADQDLTLQYLRVPNKAILDFLSTRDTIATPALQINKVRVVIDSLTHSFDGDLDIYIYAPNGDSLELTTDNGGGGDHYINTTFDDAAGTSIVAGAAPFSGSFRPEGVPGLSRFIGSMPAGDWVLRVFDDATGDTGILKRWRLLVDVKAPPDTLIVRKYNDADGNMATTGDRTLKAWYLELWKDSVGTGTLVGSGSTDSLYVTNLLDGTYIACEADSVGWFHIGKVRNGTPVTTSARYDTVVVSGGGVTWVTDFVNSQNPPPVLVTFRVDMRPKMLDGFFEPDTDFVEVRGSFNGWSAGDTLADGDADSIYTKTLTLAPNTSFDYKFYKSPRGLYGWEDDISNRNVMTGTADTVLPAPFFNDQDFSVPVTFQVNMSVKMMEGTFRPDLSDQVDVRGNFNGWTGSIPMTDGDNDSIYTVALTIGSSTTIQYKFFKTLRGGIDWEGIPNRSFAIPSNTPSTIPSDYFDKDSVANIPAFLASPSSIPFGSVEVADSLKDTVFVYNTGLASMNISSITSDNPTFTLTPNSGTLAQGESLLVCVFFIPDSAQGETGNIVFTHDASTSPDTVTVSGMGFVLTPMYFLTLTPDSVFSENPVKPGKSNKPVKRQKGLYPNWSNLVDEVNAQGGFAPGTSESDSAGGMLIGSSYMFNAGGAGPLAKWKPVKDSASVYCWVRLAKWDFKKSIGKSFAKIQSTLYKKGIGFHTGPAGGLDSIDLKFKRLTKQLTKLDPKKHSNKLYAELVALKVNIAASAMGKTPAGLGDLLFDVNGNFLDEMSLIEISNKADSMMTFWEGYSQDDFDSLHSAVYNINRAFVGPLDTVTFETTSIPFPDGKLTVAGQVDLNTVTFLKAPVPFVATRIAALNGEVESPEGFEDEEFEDEEGSAPVAAKLYQNYPNPFNPSTTIAFNLRETSLVTVKIYNLLGQEMVTLLSNEDMDEGFQTVQFSAEQLSSGVYFYRIEAQGQDDTSLRTIETRKMVLLK